MATNEQGGSMLYNRSQPQEYMVDLCLNKMSYEVWQGLLQLRQYKKMMMLLSSLGLQSKPPKKVRILTMQIKELKSKMEEIVWLPIIDEDH